MSIFTLEAALRSLWISTFYSLIHAPRLSDLLGGPRGGRMRRDVEVQHSPAVVHQDHQHEQHTKGGRRKSQEVDRIHLFEVVARNVRHLCEGGLRRRGSNRETVRSEISMPGSSNSPWMRGAPHAMLALAVCLINDLTSAPTAWLKSGGGPACSRDRHSGARAGTGGDRGRARGGTGSCGRDRGRGGGWLRMARDDVLMRFVVTVCTLEFVGHRAADFAITPRRRR